LNEAWNDCYRLARSKGKKDMNLSIGLKVFLSCCLLVPAAGCRKTHSDGAGTSSVNPITATTDPRGAVTKAMSAMLAAKSYRARWVTSSSSGTNSTMMLEFVAPDRYHLVREAERSAGNVNKMETIVVGQETFMKMGDGSWQRFPVNVGELIARFRDPKVIEELSKSAEVKFVGADTVDGSATMVYQYTYSDPEGKGVKTTAKTWIGVANNLPLRTESEAESEIMGKKINSKSTITYYDYNADIKIERPTQ
jgi:hypothetical protein